MDWIKVSDQPPNLFQEVIICSSDNKVKAAVYLKNGKWNTFLDVEYWMPMPEPPHSDSKVVPEELKKKRGRPKKVELTKE